MPRPIAAEFEALRHVPTDIGTVGIAYDDTEDNALDHAYVVTTFVPGQIRPAAEWTEAQALTHARQLARLHHAVGGTSEPSPSASMEAAEGLAWWSTERPDIVGDPRVQRLLEPWQRFIREREDAWDGATQHRLIHSDLVVTNIIVGQDDIPRYIDWEWGGPGDVAKDLAMFGGAIAGGPWYVEMDGAATSRFLDEYARTRTDLGSPVHLERLRVQRDAWEVTERLLGCLHFLTKAASDPVYREATNRLLGGLERRLSG